MSITIKLGQLAEFLGATLRGDKDKDITGLAALEEAGPGQISFLAKPQYRKYLVDTQPLPCCSSLQMPTVTPAMRCWCRILIWPTRAFRIFFDPKPKSSAGVHPTAVIAEDAQVDPAASIGAFAVIESGARLAANVTIGAHCFIGARSEIGEGGWLAPRVTLYHDVRIGKRVVIQSGAVLGGEGFGFVNDKGVWQKFAQIGGVTLGDDVEIGVNTAIDRGALSDTRIGNGVKLDNQIHIAHNVQIGDHTAMAACVGISGSAKIGKHCMLAGGVGLVGHIDICDGVYITGMTMVTHSITEPGSYSSGTAMQPSAEWRKSAARLRKIDDMARRLQKLEKAVETVTCADNRSSDG